MAPSTPINPPTLRRRRSPADLIEILESRIAPATLVSLNSSTHLLTVQGDYVDDGSSTVQAGAAENLSFTVSGGNLLITDSTHHVTISGTGLTQAGTGQVSVPVSSLTGDLAIDTGTGTDSLTFSDTLAIATNHNLTAHTPGTISFNSSSVISASGTGALSFTSERNIAVGTGASLTTVNGTLLLSANEQASHATGSFHGIDIFGATLQVTGSGNLTVKGTGGTSGSEMYGLLIDGGSSLLGGTSGTVLVQGHSGATTADGANGVVLRDPTTNIGSAGASVQIVGVGQATGTAASSRGVIFTSGSVSVGGSGTLSIQGTGSTTGNSDGDGIVIDGVVGISTNNGAISLTGVAGASNNASLADGISIHTATVSAGGATSGIAISGTVGLGMGAGFRLAGASITTAGGDVLINASSGSAGISSNNEAIEFSATGASIDTSAHGGNIMLAADSMELSFGTLHADSTHTVTLKPLTAATAINLGGSSSAGTLGLTDAELDIITAGTTQIGDTNSGAITVSAALTPANHLSLTTGAGITFNQAVTVAAGKSLTATAVSTISLPNATSTLAAGGTGAISLTTARDISLATGSSIATVDGNLTLSANQQATPTSGGFDGISVQGLTQATGAGSVTLHGRAGDSGFITAGVNMFNGQILGGTSGLVTVQGTGADASTQSSGVQLYQSTISSSGANVVVTGSAGDSSSGGSIGVYLNSGALISAGGTGTVAVSGVAANGAQPWGIFVPGGGGTVTSTAGAVTIEGVGTNDYGIEFGSGEFSSGGTAPLTIMADGITVGGTIRAGSAGGGTATFKPHTAGTAIVVGGNDVLTGTKVLGLSDFELDDVSAATVQIGDSNSGAITVSAAITHANNLSLTTGAGLSGSGALMLAAGKNLSLTSNGAINLTGALTVPGTTTVSAGAGAISLANANNAFTGPVALSNTGANNVTLVDVNALLLGNVSVGSGTLSVTAVGIDEGAFTVTQAAGAGAATFSAGAGLILLQNIGNSFTGPVSLMNSGGGFNYLYASGPLTLGNSTVSGILQTFDSGSLTISGTINLTQVASFSADALDLVGSITSPGEVGLGPFSVTAIDLGSTAGPGSTLNISNTELSHVTADKITVGSYGAITIAVSAPLTLGSSLNLVAGGSIAFNQSVTMAAGKNLTAMNVDVASSITLPTASSDLMASGTGAISLTAARDIVVGSGASMTTVNGALTLSANGSGTTVGDFDAVLVNGGTIQSTGSGNVTVTGKGGQGGVNPVGVLVQAGGMISGGTSGTISVTGTGGGGTLQFVCGVFVTDAGSLITSSGADVQVMGTGGSSTNSGAVGVEVFQSGRITAGGTGSVMVQGTGGSAAAGGNHGIDVSQGIAAIYSNNGAVQLTGLGGGGGTTGSDNYGVSIANNGTVTAGNAANTVTVTGTGGGGSGGNNVGLYVQGSSAQITSGGGAVLATGAGGTGGTGNLGVKLATSALITTATNGGNLTLVADTMNLAGTVSANATGMVTLRPQTAGVVINLGSAVDTTASTLALSDAELDFVSAGTVQIGDSNSGALTVSAAITHLDTSSLVLAAATGQNVNLNANLTTAGGALTFANNAVLGAGVTLDTTNAGGTVAGAAVNFSSAINLNTNTLTVQAGAAASFLAGTINGSGGLIKQGTGALTLAGANVYTGATTISAGALRAATAGALPGATDLTIASGAVLDLNGYDQAIDGFSGAGMVTSSGVTPVRLTIGSANQASATFSGVILNGIGGVALTKTGTGTQTLSGANSYSGGTVLNAGSGTLVATVGVSQSALGAGAAAIGTGSTLQLNNTNTAPVDVTIGNTFAGAGTLRLSFSAGSASRSTVMSNVTGFTGTIQLVNSGATGDKYSVGGGFATSAMLTVSSGNQLFSPAGTTATFGGISVQGTGNLDNFGAIRLGGTLGGNITLAADTTIGGDGGTLTGNILSGAAGTQTVTFAGSGSGIATVSGVIGGGTGITALTQNRSGGILTLMNAGNTYAGTTTITAGALRLGAADVIPDGATKGNVVVSGTLDLGGFSETINGLSGAGVVDNSVAGGPYTLTIGGNNATASFSGVLQNTTGSLALKKTGSGTQTLTGVSTYTGSTIVAGGTLALSNTASNDSLASPVLDVQTGATLDVTGLGNGGNAQSLLLAAAQTLKGVGSVTGNIGGTGTISPGETGPGILNISGSLNPVGPVIFDLNSPYGTAGTDYDQLIVGGAVDLSAATFTFNGGAAAFAAAQPIKLISKTSAGGIVSSASYLEGVNVTASGGTAFRLSYLGGDGNDLVLGVGNGLSATLGGGKLTITDITSGGSANAYTISVIGTDLVISDPAQLFDTAPAGGSLGNGGHSLTMPLAGITAGLVLNTGSGDDTLTVDLSGGNAIPTGGLTFNGGAQITGDKLVITGGTQGTVTYNYTNAHDGSVAMSAFGTIAYTGLEPIVNSGTATDVVFNLPATANTATLADDGTAGNGLSRLSGANFELTDFANPTGTLTINRGTASDALTVNALPDFSAGVTLGSAGNPFNSLTFAGAVTLAVNKSLSAFASGTISLPNAASDLAVSGTGALTLTAATSIVLSTGSSLSTVDGAVTLSGNVPDFALGAAFGLELDGASITSSGAGEINLRSTGAVGLEVHHGAVVASTGTGAVMLAGTGQGGFLKHGVEIADSGTKITSVAGDITVLGQGGAGINVNIGVFVHSAAVISSTGTARVTLSGTGGSGTEFNYGVGLEDAGTQIATQDGDVIINGTGGVGTMSTNAGIFVQRGALISSAGAGKVTLIGTGGSGTDGNAGIVFSDDGTASSGITSAAGDITLTGTATDSTGTGQDGVLFSGSSAALHGFLTTTGVGHFSLTGTAGNGSGFGINLTGFASLTSAGAANTLVADSISIDNNSTIDAGSNTVAVRQETNGLLINLGAGDSAGTLGIAASEFARITAGTVQIGDNHSGNITVDSALTSAGNLSLTSGAGITFHQSVTLAANKSLTATALGMTDGISLPSSGSQLQASGTGAISLTSARSIGIGSGVNLIVANGALTLSANQQASANPDSFYGIDINGLVQATGSGSITVQGKGGGSGNSEVGVRLTGGGQIIGGTTGLVTVVGTGGASTGTNNYGVNVDGAGSLISSSGADVTVIGFGGPGSSGADNKGIYLANNGAIKAGGSGALTVSGTGGSGSQRNSGVEIQSGAQLATAGGAIQVNAIAGSGTSLGILLDSVTAIAAQIVAGGAGNVTLATDRLQIGNATVTATGGLVVIKPMAAAVLIDLGSTGDTAANTLELSDAELDAISGTSVQIGSGNGNSINLSSAISSTQSLTLVSGQGIAGGGGLALSAGTTLTVTAGGAINLSGFVSVPGTLSLTANGSAGGSTDITVNNSQNDLGVVNANGGTVTLRDDQGFALNNVTVSTLLKVESAGTITQQAAIGGAGGLTKLGSGTLSLTAANTYQGVTTVSLGMLALVDSTGTNPIAGSSGIVLSPGTTLDATGLGSGGTFVLASGQTLSASGATVTGNLAGSGAVQPGGAGVAGAFTINGNFTPAGTVTFDLASPYGTAGTDYDQIVVSGSVDLSAATLVFAGGALGPAGGEVAKLISKTGAGALVPAGSPAEGASVVFGNSTFAISYHGGDGNDLVLTSAVLGQVTLSATLTTGTLTITDTDSVGRANNLSVTTGSGSFVITDPVEFFAAAPAGGTLSNANHTLTLPLNAVSKAIVINSAGGDDTLTLDLGNTFPSGGLTFNAGTETVVGGNKLVLASAGQGVVTFSATDSSSGAVATSIYGTVKYGSVEAVADSGSATDVIFNLPSGSNAATLADDGTAGNALTRLSGATFATVDFTAPSGTVTVNRGDVADTLAVGALPDLTSGLALGSPAKPFGTVVLNNSLAYTAALDLSANNFSLSASQSISAPSGTLTVGAGTIMGAIGGGLGLSKDYTGEVDLNGPNTYTGETVVKTGPLFIGSSTTLQNSTVRILSDLGLQFANSTGTFVFGGLAGTGDLPLMDGAGVPVTLQVGSLDSSYAGSLTGPGTLDKVGAGTLTLTGTNTHAATIVEGGILQVNSDRALGLAGNPLTSEGGILHATATFSTTRPIVLAAGATTFEASPGKTLTLAGVISGSGDLFIGDTGNVQVTGHSNTNSGSTELDSNASQMVNGVTISVPGSQGNIIVTPGATPGSIAGIDLTGTNTAVSLVVKAPAGQTVTVEKIISTDLTPIKAITLGAGVMLGDGVADNIPDLVINGKVTTLTTSDINANTIITLGKGLSYLDTYKNAPNVSIRNIMGDGVVIDVTGDGVTSAGTGGGGLGKLIVNSWAGAGTIKTTQSIKSILVKKGDLNVHLQADPGHLGAETVASVGSISIPNGMWAGTGMEVEGVVATFLTKGLAQGSMLTAGAFGVVKIKGNYLGSIVAKYDASVTTPVKNKPAKIIATGAIGNVTITSGDFSGLINGDGKVGNILLTGSARFTGTVRGGSIGNITAASFTGTVVGTGGFRRSITSIGSIGNITAKTGGLTDYLIAAGADLGSDAQLGGVADHFTSYSTSATGVNTAVSIGAVTIKGTVTGTTIEAGVNPGPPGLFGDGDDAILALPAGTKGKARIGAMKFDSLGANALAFADTAGKTVSNAFEAQTLVSIQIGKTKTVTTFLNKFLTAHYIDSGSSSIVVRLL